MDVNGGGDEIQNILNNAMIIKDNDLVVNRDPDLGMPVNVFGGGVMGSDCLRSGGGFVGDNNERLLCDSFKRLESVMHEDRKGKSVLGMEVNGEEYSIVGPHQNSMGVAAEWTTQVEESQLGGNDPACEVVLKGLSVQNARLVASVFGYILGHIAYDILKKDDLVQVQRGYEGEACGAGSDNPKLLE